MDVEIEKSLERYFADIERSGHFAIDDKEWAKLAPALVRKDPAARRRVVEGNLKLVVSLAHKVKRRVNSGAIGAKISVEDLVSEGNLGLVKAAEKFDPTKGFKFSTYATWWIFREQYRHLHEMGRTVRLPAGVESRIAAVLKAEADGKSDDVIPAWWLRSGCELLTERDEDTQGIVMAAQDAAPGETLELSEHQILLRRLLALMPAREKTILEAWDQGQTLLQIGRPWGLTRERVRQIVETGQHQLRQGFQAWADEGEMLFKFPRVFLKWAENSEQTELPMPNLKVPSRPQKRPKPQKPQGRVQKVIAEQFEFSL